MSEILITVVEITDQELFEGIKVRNKRTQQIRTIKSIPSDKTIFQMVKEGLFDPNTNIDLQTVLLNKTRFELIEE